MSKKSRDVRLGFVAVGIVLTVIGLIILMGVVHTYHETQIKYKNSIQSTATVVNASELDLRRTTKNMHNKYRYYHVYVSKIYQYVDLRLEYEGDTYEKSVRILHLSQSRTQKAKSEELLASVQPYKVGDTVEVMVPTTNPQRFNTTDAYMQTILTLPTFIIVTAAITIIIGLGCLLIYVGFKKNKKK